jgi:2'-5' RNA ligase
MATQLSLTGIDPNPARLDRLFLGIFPDSSVATQIRAFAEKLQGEHRLHGRPLATQRFHVTLCFLGDHAGLPARVVAATKDAAAGVTLPPFDVVFDHAQSFRSRGEKPFVLCDEGGNAALRELRQSLFKALQRHGLTCQLGPNYTPHLTLLYDNQTVAMQAVEPVRWKAREFVLIHSRLGKGEHIPLARWPLSG